MSGFDTPCVTLLIQLYSVPKSFTASFSETPANAVLSDNHGLGIPILNAVDFINNSAFLPPKEGSKNFYQQTIKYPKFLFIIHQKARFNFQTFRTPPLEGLGRLYSLLKLFTGFAIAAFIAWKLTVKTATNKASTPANKKYSYPIGIRYGKSFNQ